MTAPDDERRGAEPDQSKAPRLRDAAPEVAGAAVGAIIQHVLGDEVSGSLLAPFIASTIRVGQARERLWWERTAAALGAASQTSAVPLDELEQRALSDPARTELFARVIAAAGRTPLEDKIPALGRVLAAGLDPDGLVDEAFALTAALDDIEAPHLQVLMLLDSRAAGPGIPDGAGKRLGWTPAEIAAELPGHQLLLVPILQVLTLRGVIYDDAEAQGTWLSLEGGSRHTPTDLGRRCLKLLADD